MADFPVAPEFEESPYNTSFELPKFEPRMALCDVLAPAPNSAHTIRPTKGQGFPLGSGG